MQVGDDSRVLHTEGAISFLYYLLSARPAIRIRLYG